MLTQSRRIRWSGKGPRFAIYLDLENLTREYWEAREWDLASRALDSLLTGFYSRGVALARVAACNAKLAGLLQGLLVNHNIETMIHSGGENAADELLLQDLEEVPDECNVVVIGSGDFEPPFVVGQLGLHLPNGRGHLW